MHPGLHTGTSVKLTATVATGYKFVNWSNGCTGTATSCTVAMSAAKTVTANFVRLVALTVTKAGKGTVTSDTGGIDCGNDCSAGYFQLDSVALTATPAEGSVFDRWLGVCASSGTNPTCTVTLNRDSTAIASFVPAAAAPSVTTYQYGPMGNLTQVEDPLGNVSKTEYDSLGQAVRQLEPDAATPGVTEGLIDTVYDSLGQVKEVIDSRNLSTRYGYDNLGNLLTLDSPDTGLTTHTYDEAGNLKTRIDARGRVSSYSYDRENRLVQATYDDQVTTYAWDACTNGKGRLCAIATNGNSLAFTYDPHGRVTGQKQVVGSTELNLEHQYNADGQLYQSKTPGGNTVGYVWQGGRIEAITLNGQTVIDQVLYEPDGQVGGWTWGNGMVSDRFYDLNGRPVAISLGFDALGVQQATRSYYYDAASRITDILDDIDPTLAASYSYDGLGRLIGSLGERTFDYAYDLSGNRTNKVVDGTGGEASTIDPGSNRLQQKAGSQATNYGYDAAGHLTGDGTYTYGYDGQGRRTSATAAGLSASYAYNGLGQRVKKVVNGQTTLYAYDGQGRLIGEYDATGQLIQETLWLGDLPFAVLKPSSPQSTLVNVYHIYSDHLSTPRKITRPSDNKVMWAWESEAFGNNLPNQNPSGLGEFNYNLRFPGQYYDQETGLYSNYFRDYDPSTGRYIQSDPIGLAAGINTYAYVLNNPLRWTDPLGLEVVFEGPDKAVRALQSAYNKVKSTEKGAEMCEKLENSPDTYTITNKFPYNIPGLNPSKAFYHEVTKTITVDPNYHPRVNTADGSQPAPTATILGHEIGHAATGIEDDGTNRMNNVNSNENPVRQQLGLPIRTTYP